MAAIGRLSAGVAHEINNPLAIIEENAGLLKDLASMSEESLPNSKVIERVEAILKSVERCSAITHRLLGFAKHMDVRRDRVNLEVLVREVLGFLEKEAVHRDLQVTLDIPDDLPEIETGRGELQQVFLNIINNAFAAVQDGGKIHVSMDSFGEDRVLVHIVDDGVGIPENVLKHIFEPFFTTKKGSGTGLGLSITYGIVEKLGGKISVNSRVDEGTTFVIDLPIKRP
jgi:signal transduction histidine kinase